MRQSLLQVETERLIIRPLQKEDYVSWYKGFHNRLSSQYKYDDGYILRRETELYGKIFK